MQKLEVWRNIQAHNARGIEAQGKKFVPNLSIASCSTFTSSSTIVSYLTRGIFLALLFLLSSCSDKNVNVEIDTPTVVEVKPKPNPKKYISKNDLSGIKEHGSLRLIAPAFDQDDALPVAGLSLAEYKTLAETFAESQNLDVKWYFVDAFADLIPALLDGHGDIIIANLSETNERKKQLAFARELSRVNEWVVSKKSLKLNQPEDLEPYKIVIPRGTAYEESLNKFGLADNIQLLDTHTPLYEVLASIEKGEFDVTIVDDALVKPILGDYPTLGVDFTLKKKRKIAWAVRKENPEQLISDFHVL